MDLEHLGIPIYGVHRHEGGRWSIYAPSNRHPGDCAVIHCVDAIDEPAWISPQVTLPFDVPKRQPEPASAQVIHMHRAVMRRSTIFAAYGQNV
jgi:hypothetical protein